MRVSLLTGVIILLFSASSGLLGLRVMQRFDYTPGGDSEASVQWPGHTGVAAPSGRPVVMLFVHPLCNCTKATLSELRQILAESRVQPDVRIFFEPEGDARAALWNEAAALPGASVAWDDGGRLARRFGARTSGILKVYDARGRLSFDGGITSARGHEGRSSGGDALLSALTGAGSGVRRFPAFGCAFVGTERS